MEVELRVDIGGSRPMNVISADYSELDDPGAQYRESMQLVAPTVTHRAKLVTIEGLALFSAGAPRRRIVVSIPVDASGPQDATLRHLTTGGRLAFECVCTFEGEHFRSVELEEATERGVDRPQPYNTASRRSRARARTLSMIAAFEEAGIEMRTDGDAKVIDRAEAGVDAAWSDAELHAAMERHFTKLGDGPRWAVWLLHAVTHADPHLAGLMFDRRGPQRQGCAVFYGPKPATTDDQRRDRLYDCVHELGHAFNLPHCWHRTLYAPPIPARPDSLTWMNYPTRNREGPLGFFRDFPFEFDAPEVIHLRHGFRQNVIMGGAGFADGSPTGGAHSLAPDRIDPALRLRLAAPARFALNFPVTAVVELSTTAPDGRTVAATLDPRSGNVDYEIRRPDGTTTLFEPLLRHCRGGLTATLHPGKPIVDYPFLHFGREGFEFPEPGRYELRARYTAPDGRIALSRVVPIRIEPPAGADDRAVDALIGGDEDVGKLLTLMGSRAPALKDADDKLNRIIQEHPGHPMATVSRIVRATGLAADFKTIDDAGEIQVMPADVREAFELIKPVVDLSVPMGAAARVRGEEAQRAAFSKALQRVNATAGMSPISTFRSSASPAVAIVRTGLAKGRVESMPPLPPRPKPAPKEIVIEQPPDDYVEQPPKKTYETGE